MPLGLAGCLEAEKQAIHDKDFGGFLRAARDDIKTLNEALCNEKSIEKRRIIITIIRLKEPLWPDDGFCEYMPAVKPQSQSYIIPVG